MKKHEKRYSDIFEFRNRYQHFETSLKRVYEKNEKAKLTGSRTRYGINMHSDLSPEEFDSQMKGFIPKSLNHTKRFVSSSTFTAP